MATFWYGTRAFEMGDDDAVTFFAAVMDIIRRGEPSVLTITYSGTQEGSIALAITSGIPIHIELGRPLDTAERDAIYGSFEWRKEDDGGLSMVVAATE